MCITTGWGDTRGISYVRQVHVYSSRVVIALQGVGLAYVRLGCCSGLPMNIHARGGSGHFRNEAPIIHPRRADLEPDSIDFKDAAKYLLASAE